MDPPAEASGRPGPAVRRIGTRAAPYLSLDVSRITPLHADLNLNRIRSMPNSATKTGFAASIEAGAEAFNDIESANLGPLLERIGEARVVLIGEASHGTSEFYRMRQRITQALIEEKGFRIIGIEGDWPDVERIDDYVRLKDGKAERPREAFARFPTWMWKNHEVLSFVDWLHEYNRERKAPERTWMCGLDLYSLYNSIHEVIEALERAGAEDLARIARTRYSGLLAYEPEAQDYGRAVFLSAQEAQEDEVVAMLSDLLARRLQEGKGSAEAEQAFDAEQNARVVANAEEYYRILFQGGRSSWNLRDKHMFETLEMLLGKHGPDAKAIVWAHNSHIGDARATEMGRRGELNIGQLCAEAFGDDSYRIGFGTHHGTVAAAQDWGRPVQVMQVNPSLPGSHEWSCHESGIPRFFLPLRPLRGSSGSPGLAPERAIGVIYRPATEIISHYFEADLDRQFDEYLWFDESKAVTPIEPDRAPDLPERHPFLCAD